MTTGQHASEYCSQQQPQPAMSPPTSSMQQRLVTWPAAADHPKWRPSRIECAAANQCDRERIHYRPAVQRRRRRPAGVSGESTRGGGGDDGESHSLIRATPWLHNQLRSSAIGQNRGRADR